MTTVEVFCYPGGDKVNKALIAGKYAGVNVTAPAFAFGTDNKTCAYKLNCHPLGRVPVAKTPEGYLFESNSIVRYIARLDASGALYGGHGPYEASQVDQWIDFTANEVEPPINVLVGPILGYLPKNEAQQQAATAGVMTVFEALNVQLEVRTFLVGERVTAADIVLGTLLEKFFRLVTDKKFKESFPHILRYVDTCINQPHFHAVLAEAAKKAPATASASTTAHKEEKKEKAAPAAKKEEAPKKEAAKKKDDDEEEEEAIPGFDDEKSAEKALKAILDTLPPSPFVMDEFKRCYSNNDTRTVAAPFLFEKFDPKGFTAFFATYKYNSDLKQAAFMSANLVGGWFQRMDHLHKYVFGVVTICGTPQQQNIHGFFIVRGTGMPVIMSNVDDIENYTWETIEDISAHREKITDYLACDGKLFESNPVQDWRVYK